MSQAKNVLLILTDQQRKDTIGAYGNTFARTPNMDRLAREGTCFERAYCQNPFCCPSRASIMTGLYPRTHGLWHNGIRFDEVGAPTLADLLQEQGFRTGSTGKIHLGPRFGPYPEAGYEESSRYWNEHPEMKDWHGPLYGFEDVWMALGHINYGAGEGHYGAYLAERFPQGKELIKREYALVDRGHHQTWHNAMPEAHHPNTWIADRTIEMVDRLGGDPWFIHCSFPDPHHPLSACEPYASMFDPADMPDPLACSLEELEQLPPTYKQYHLGQENYFAPGCPSFPDEIAGEPLSHMMAQMHGMVAHVDACIGRILDHLESKGLLEDTLIIFTSDHGELMGDHGLIFKGPFYYQPLLNIPLIIRMPDQQPAVRDELTAHVDLVPTALECLGVDVPGYLPGRSLTGHLQGAPEHARAAVLTEFRPFDGPNMKVLHTDEWKYVYYNGEPWGELFNLKDDPEERQNLYDRREYAGIRAELHGRLLDELVATEAAWPPRGAWI